MRYFLTTDAARVYTLGGFSFAFEPVRLQGGSWLGVLAVDEPAASILASFHPSGTDEISIERYDSLKKKGTADQGPGWGRPPRANPALAVADRVGAPIGPTTASPAKVPDHNSTAHITAVTLLTTSATPPNEPLLGGPPSKRRPF